MKPIRSKITLLTVARYCISSAVIAAIVSLYLLWLHVNETTVAMTLLVCVLMVAARWGLRHSIYLSIVCAAAFNYFFLPPVFTFTIGDSRNWVALLAFLITAIIASQLAERAREEAESSRNRQKETERLYDICQQMLLAGNVIDLLNNMPHRIATTFNLDGAAVYLRDGDRIYRSRPDYMDVSSAELREAAFSRDQTVDEARTLTLVPILLGTRPIGALAVTGGETSPEVLDAISGLAAIAVERASAVETVARVEASRESERLRNALLDSVAHELRTPLTSITVAITTLRSGEPLDPAQREDLMEVIEEEALRLDRLVGDAMEMADLEAHEITLSLRPYAMHDAVALAVKAAEDDLEGHPVEIRMAESLPPVVIDLERISKVIQHLLENAAKYSEFGSPIYISAEATAGRFVTSVADRGAGVDDMEKAMIFNKFYRGQETRYRVQGTGMGLAIAKTIVEAHGGSIEVTSQPGTRIGLLFLVPTPCHCVTLLYLAAVHSEYIDSAAHVQRLPGTGSMATIESGVLSKRTGP